MNLVFGKQPRFGITPLQREAVESRLAPARFRNILKAMKLSELADVYERQNARGDVRYRAMAESFLVDRLGHFPVSLPMTNTESQEDLVASIAQHPLSQDLFSSSIMRDALAGLPEKLKQGAAAVNEFLAMNLRFFNDDLFAGLLERLDRGSLAGQPVSDSLYQALLGVKQRFVKKS